MITRDQIRAMILAELADTGFEVTDRGLEMPSGDAKDVARKLHAPQRQDLMLENADFIDHHEEVVMKYLANGEDIDPSAIYPVIKPVETPLDIALFRYAALTWSVPVSQGYGRRNRFLVFDASNSKLIGIMALGDPVINLGARDRYIGWNQEQRHKRLYNIFDGFVLGALSPYRELLGGKLIALLSTCDEVTDHLALKYAGTTTGIGKVKKMAMPAMVTTSSSLGRSSIYNRLTYRGEKAFIPVGFTAGFGHFHFSGKLFQDMLEFVRESGEEISGQYGAGSNFRIRVIRKALMLAGLPSGLLQHGINREVFVAPLATNWREFLTGEGDELLRVSRPAASIGAYYRERWAIPRASRNDEFLSVKKTSSRLSEQLVSRDRQLSLTELVALP
jgi:hypothetical protein